MTEHTVTRKVYRIEEHTITLHDNGRTAVEDVEIDSVSQTPYECSCGAVLETSAAVEDHLP